MNYNYERLGDAIFNLCLGYVAAGGELYERLVEVSETDRDDCMQDELKELKLQIRADIRGILSDDALLNDPEGAAGINDIIRSAIQMDQRLQL